MFYCIGKEIKDKLLSGELANVSTTKIITKTREATKEKKKGCCWLDGERRGGLFLIASYSFI